jgi:hypothetical protein
MRQIYIVMQLCTLFALAFIVPRNTLLAQSNDQPVRVFIFAGQSNMVGTHSRVVDIPRYPPFADLNKPQANVLFSYKLGREEMATSNGWVDLQPTGDYFGPELSFGRRVSQNIEASIAIIKIASGGTSLGEDWNPDQPGGFKLYPLALEHIRSALADLDRKGLKYQLEGFMWHQGENDMFDKSFKPRYQDNLRNFLASWRRDLNAPNLKFYIGELCTKTIWGMDNRDNMYAIRTAQKAVVASDKFAEYVPTSHDAVEIGGGAGLHYHYGTLGQLQHGVNYADAYLRTIGKFSPTTRPLAHLPYEKGSLVKLFVLAGHRNMEGERAFTQHLESLKGNEALASDNPQIAFQYCLGGGFTKSSTWEPLGAVGPYQTFGPELSFAKALQAKNIGNFAIAKFTHSGSQINDWTPAGSSAKDLNLYHHFISFIRNAIQDLKDKGHTVEVAGVFYHIGENDMAFYPYKKEAANWLKSIVEQSRQDLSLPNLKWVVSQQPPPIEEGLDRIDITVNLAALAGNDKNFIHLKAIDLPKQEENLVLDTAGVIALGRLLAEGY